MPKNKNKGTSVDFPIDHPDVEKHYKFRKKKSAEYKKKAPKMTAILDALGQGEKKYVTKERSAKFLGEMARNRAQQLTATEGSFAKGGLVKSGKPKIAKKGWR
jgi:hypothetical protein